MIIIYCVALFVLVFVVVVCCVVVPSDFGWHVSVQCGVFRLRHTDDVPGRFGGGRWGRASAWVDPTDQRHKT